MTRKGPKPRPLDLESSVLTIFFTILRSRQRKPFLFEGVLIYITWFTRKFSSTLSAVFPQAVTHFSVLKIMFYFFFLLFPCFSLRLIAGLCAFFFSLGTNTDFLMTASVCVPCWLATEKKDDQSLANFQTS